MNLPGPQNGPPCAGKSMGILGEGIHHVDIGLSIQWSLPWSIDMRLPRLPYLVMHAAGRNIDRSPVILKGGLALVLWEILRAPKNLVRSCEILSLEMSCIPQHLP